MKRLISIVAALLLILGAAAQAEGLNLKWADFFWTEKPDGMVHVYDDCPIIWQESDFDVVMGTAEQAMKAGKYVFCVQCMQRLMGSEYGSAAGFTLSPGLYVVGQDIPAGAWRVDLSAGLAGIAQIIVYKNYQDQADDVPAYDMLLSEYENITTIGKINLLPGNIVFCDSILIFSPFAGVTP